MRQDGGELAQGAHAPRPQHGLAGVEQQALRQPQDAVLRIERDLDLALAQQREHRRQHVAAGPVVAHQVIGDGADLVALGRDPVALEGELVALAGELVALAGEQVPLEREPVLLEAHRIARVRQLRPRLRGLVLGAPIVERERHQQDDEEEQHPDHEIADQTR